MDDRVGEDMETYRVALEATGGTFGGVEPVSRFHEAFQAPIDAAYAAAVVGLQTETFLERIRENTGLQNIGLLALDNPNGSVKRDTWTSSFRDIISSLDSPQLVGEPPVITQPDVLPGGQVHIPDSNLHAAVAEALGKSANAPITAEEMKRLRRLDVRNRGIRDLTGLQFATNLTWLHLPNNTVSDLSPIAGLIEMRELWVHENPLSDISPVRNLANLTHLGFEHTSVSDLSPVSRLISLKRLDFRDADVSDLSPVAGLINLESLDFSFNNVSDLSPVAGLVKLKYIGFGANKGVSDISAFAGLINLESIYFGGRFTDISPIAGLINLKSIITWGNRFSDLSPLTKLTKLERVDICGSAASDLTPLSGLTNLKELYLVSNEIEDISPLAVLTGLNRLNLGDNDISDISPLAELTNLKWVAVDRNRISDFSPLEGLGENLKLVWYDNPAFPKGGPKIEGPWLWAVLPGTRLGSGTDLLSEASGGKVTEVGIATHGATLGKPVGDEVWTSHKLPPTGAENIKDMLKRDLSRSVVYGTVPLYSPREQGTTMYVGAWHGLKVWLNGVLIHAKPQQRRSDDYSDFFPVTLKKGKNILLVAIATHSDHANAFFGFEARHGIHGWNRHQLHLFRDSNPPRRYVYVRCACRQCVRLGGLAI